MGRNKQNETYNTAIDKEIAFKESRTADSSLLRKVSSKLDNRFNGFLIANITTAILTNRPASLQIAFGVLVWEKGKVNTLYDFGVTCTCVKERTVWNIQWWQPEASQHVHFVQKMQTQWRNVTTVKSCYVSITLKYTKVPGYIKVIMLYYWAQV